MQQQQQRRQQQQRQQQQPGRIRVALTHEKQNQTTYRFLCRGFFFTLLFGISNKNLKKKNHFFVFLQHPTQTAPIVKR